MGKFEKGANILGRLFFIGFFLVWCTGFFGGMIYGIFFQTLNIQNRKSYNYYHNSYDYADIVKVDYVGTLLKNGDLLVEETLYFDINAESLPFRELYRKFNTTNEDIQRGVEVDSDTFTVTEKTDGQNISYGRQTQKQELDKQRQPGTFGVVQKTNGLFELQWYINMMYGSPVYTITYTYKNVLDVFSDAAQLDIMLYTGGSIAYVKEYNAKFVFPDGITQSEGFKYFSHNQPYADIEITGNELKLHIENPKASVNLDLGFIELRTVMDKSALPVFADAKNIRNDYTYDSILKEESDWAASYNSFEKKVKTTMIVDIALAVPIFIIIIVLCIYLKRKVLHPFKPVTNYKYFRDIPDVSPELAAELVATRKIISGKPLAGAILSLCEKDFLRISKIDEAKDWNKNNIKMTLLKQGQSGLSKYEKAVMTYIVGLGLRVVGASLTLSAFERSSISSGRSFYIAQSSAIKEERNDSGYFSKPKFFVKNMTGFMLFIGLSASIITGVLTALFTVTTYGFAFLTPLAILWSTIIGVFGFIMGSKKDILTQEGENIAAECVGLYNFFDDLTLINEAELPHISKWEKYLVYATAFGLSEKVSKALAVRYPNEYNDGRYFSRFGHSCYAAGCISRSVNSSSRSYSYSSSSSGGGFSGGGGGFSSGGGGGGHGGGGGGGRH